MKKFMNWLEASFTPIMTRVNTNVWVVSVKDAIMQTLPFIFLGSVFVMLAILNEYFPNLPSFWTPFGWTMGMVSLFVAFLIPFNLMEKKRLRQNRINAGLSGLVLFLIIITPQVVLSGEPGFGHEALGAGGMFIAMVAGLVSGLIFNFIGKFTFFKPDSALPDFVKAWFDSMLPIAIVVVLGWVIVDLFNVDLYNIILSIFKPLSFFVETPYGFAFIMLIVCFIYSLGISSWILTPVLTPVFLEAITANMTLGASNLVTETTLYSAYLWVGGIGCTLPLVIMAMRSKSKRIGALGKACFIPSIFNINEPVVFGMIAWNPFLMVPMWLQGLVLPLVTWLFTKVIAFAPIPKILFQLWYFPFPISTWIVTNGSINALLLLLINVIISTCIWWPFFKLYENQVVTQEVLEAEGEKYNG